MTTLALYAELSSEWSRAQNVQRVVKKIFDWHVWSIFWLMLQMGYLIMLRLVDGRVRLGLHSRPVWYAVLVFLTTYSGFQIWNHTLNAWWAFRDPSKFEKKEELPQEQYTDRS